MTAAAIIAYLNAALAAGQALEPFVVALYKIVIQKQALTDAERAALDDSAALLTNELNAENIPEDQQ